MHLTEDGYMMLKGDEEMEEKMVLSIKEVAHLLNVSVRHIAGMDKKGLLPRPVRLGKSVRFVRVEIGAWIRSGCPSRELWEEMKTNNLNIDNVAQGLANCYKDNRDIAINEKRTKNKEEFIKNDAEHFHKLSKETDPLEGITEIPPLSIKKTKACIPTKRPSKR